MVVTSLFLLSLFLDFVVTGRVGRARSTTLFVCYRLVCFDRTDWFRVRVKCAGSRLDRVKQARV